MAYYGVIGKTGTGKSLFHILFGCKLANQRRKTIVTNLPLDFVQLRKFCGMMGYSWLAHCIDMNRIVIKPGAESVNDLINYPNAVALIDEAGVFFDCHSSREMPRSVRADLAQVRKGGTDVIWAAQYFDQVDKQIRSLSQYIIHCAGTVMYDRELRNDKLVWKKYIHFEPEQYEAWMSDIKARRPGIGGEIRTRFQYAYKVESGLLKKSDYQAFKVFRSFDRLDTNYSTFENPYELTPYQDINAYFPGDPLPPKNYRKAEPIPYEAKRVVSDFEKAEKEKEKKSRKGLKAV